MADSGLLISWGETYPGREQQVLRLWNEVGEFYGSLLEAGRISRFEPFLVAGRGAPLRGFTKRRSTYVPASGSSRPSQAVRAICESSFFDSGQRRQACMIRATRSRGSPPGRRR